MASTQDEIIAAAKRGQRVVVERKILYPGVGDWRSEGLSSQAQAAGKTWRKFGPRFKKELEKIHDARPPGRGRFEVEILFFRKYDVQAGGGWQIDKRLWYSTA
ncbi:hypothetical protein N9917_03230 [Deltaproteobacteria bacterium]|nr:hypothetical protein [Deltaproteobacteria bacterium]